MGAPAITQQFIEDAITAHLTNPARTVVGTRNICRACPVADALRVALAVPAFDSEAVIVSSDGIVVYGTTYPLLWPVKDFIWLIDNPCGAYDADLVYREAALALWNDVRDGKIGKP